MKRAFTGSLRRAAAVVGLALASSNGWAAPTSPEAFLGHPVGADRKLAGYTQIVRYFEALDRESDRIELDTLGTSTLGRPLVMAVISSPENLRDAARYRDIARRLADPRALSVSEADRLIAEGKVIVLVTCNIHSSEIGSSQMAMEWAHQLATRNDQETRSWLDGTFLLLMPSINPDGTDMIVDYYNEYVGTAWEGGRLPWLYHHYAGHDNNRDWFMLNLAETRLVNRVLHHEWYPQVFLDEHQMGATTPRIFVPPYANPLTPLVHPMQWRLNDLVGTRMALRLEQSGKSGVIDSYAYDAYWPGGTKNTACLKNVIGLLTEVSSCRIATPVFVDPAELSGGRKGLPDYGPQINFPNPWPGGWWRLRDIVDYELIASNSLLETCAEHREEFLRATHQMARDAITRGAEEPPFAYVIPRDQHDPAAAAAMADLLREHGLEAKVAREPFSTADGRRFEAGSVVFLAAQPYRPFLVEMMERQRYPEVRQGPDTKEIFRPYDVTAWSLPLLMGVECVRVDRRFEAAYETAYALAEPDIDLSRAPAGVLVPPGSNASHALVNQLLAKNIPVERLTAPVTATIRHGAWQFPAGSFLIPSRSAAEVGRLARELRVDAFGVIEPFHGTRAKLGAVRLGLYKPWAASMDEGWTRLVLDRHHFKYTSLDNAALRKGGLRSRYDAILLPDMDKNVIVDGRTKPEEGPTYFEPLPPPYAGGIGKEGVAALKEFVEQGGTLICLGESSDLPLEEFNLPARNAVARARSTEYSLPGTLVRLELDSSHPLAWGMAKQCDAYYNSGPVFTTNVPGANVARAVVARFPEHADQVVSSGWAKGTEMMAGRAALVEAGLGKGRVVLFGFGPQNRAWTPGTFKLLFNAIWRGARS